MIRSVVAVLAGVVVGFILVAVSDMSCMVFATRPPGLDTNDPAAMAAFIATLPPLAFVIMLVGHALAAFGAGFIAAWIARRARATHALIVGALILTAAIWNFSSFEHPLFFKIGEVLIYLPAAYAGSLAAPQPRKSTVPVSA